MLKLENIQKRLGDFALADISITVPEGEYFVLLGRSGSGKSQLLELIAGLNHPDSGEIYINNENVTGKKIQERNVGLVFQDYAIFPNLTVYGNIAYSLHCRKYNKKDTDIAVGKIAAELNIVHLLDRYVDNLSGGELQRVALARTLVTSPRLLLLDEPMASVDASLKDDIRGTLRKLKNKGLTIVHVTHDYGEAISLATRVGVIHNGRIIQSGTPEEVFDNPVNKFVARYTGVKNFFRAEFLSGNGKWKARSGKGLQFSIAENKPPKEGLVIIKSDDINLHMADPGVSPDNCFRGVVTEIYPSERGMEITIDAGELFYIEIARNDFRSLGLKIMSKVWITFSPDAVRILSGPS